MKKSTIAHLGIILMIVVTASSIIMKQLGLTDISLVRTLSPILIPVVSFVLTNIICDFGPKVMEFIKK